MNDLLLYLWQSFYITILTFSLAFGIPILLAFIQNFISGMNERLSCDVAGKSAYVFFVASIGVPVHEMGHALFAIIFKHKITEIKFFKPDPENGSLGYVNHTYNSNNLYQTIGNFFIGIGPVIFGTLVLYILSHILFSYDSILKYSSDLNVFEQSRFILEGSWALLASVFSSGSFLKSFIFLYLVFAIGSSITLSASDLQGAWRGFRVLLVFLFLINFATLWLSDFASTVLLGIGKLASGFALVLGISIVLNSIFLGLLVFVKYVLKR